MGVCESERSARSDRPCSNVCTKCKRGEGPDELHKRVRVLMQMDLQAGKPTHAIKASLTLFYHVTPS